MIPASQYHTSLENCFLQINNFFNQLLENQTLDSSKYLELKKLLADKEINDSDSSIQNSTSYIYHLWFNLDQSFTDCFSIGFGEGLIRDLDSKDYCFSLGANQDYCLIRTIRKYNKKSQSSVAGVSNPHNQVQILNNDSKNSSNQYLEKQEFSDTQSNPILSSSKNISPQKQSPNTQSSKSSGSMTIHAAPAPAAEIVQDNNHVKNNIGFKHNLSSEQLQKNKVDQQSKQIEQNQQEQQLQQNYLFPSYQQQQAVKQKSELDKSEEQSNHLSVSLKSLFHISEELPALFEQSKKNDNRDKFLKMLNLSKMSSQVSTELQSHLQRFKNENPTKEFLHITLSQILMQLIKCPSNDEIFNEAFMIKYTEGLHCSECLQFNKHFIDKRLYKLKENLAQFGLEFDNHKSLSEKQIIFSSPYNNSLIFCYHCNQMTIHTFSKVCTQLPKILILKDIPSNTTFSTIVRGDKLVVNSQTYNETYEPYGVCLEHSTSIFWYYKYEELIKNKQSLEETKPVFLVMKLTSKE